MGRGRAAHHAVSPAHDNGSAPHELPIDPDVDVRDFRLSIVAMVFAGGCIGGLVRYAVTRHWPTADDRFPWPTFTVNLAGAFILAVLIVVVSERLRGSRYLRPLIGTGFCGALTTFASVVVAADEAIAHGHAGLAAVYLAASIVGGLAVAWLGLRLGRSYVAARDREVGA
jgi:fluoride exporter